MKIKTRFAPSPTGYLHVGGARTALYSWLFARNHGGEFVLRIEDTDLERSTPEAIEAIMDGMNWLSLEWDEGPYYQTKRFDRYNAVIDQMLEEGTAYKCYCSKERLEALREEQMAKGEKPRYDGRCRHSHEHHADDEPCVVRFANPQEGSVVFDDQIRGPIEFSNQELDDLIIRRTDGSPTYNFCVVVDDWDMEITHVIRAEEHLSNTPRQVVLYEALGFPVPKFGHISLILGKDHTKMSKRHGATSVEQYKNLGYLPEAIVNFLALLGWAPQSEQEIFSIDELIKEFSMDHVAKNPAVFDIDKLNWINAQYMKKIPASQITQMAIPHLIEKGYISDTPDEQEMARLNRFTEVIRDHLSFAAQYVDFADLYYKDDFTVEDDECKAVLEEETATEVITMFKDKLAELTEFTAENIQPIFKQIMKDFKANKGIKLGGKSVYMPIRIALTGQMHGPDLAGLVEVLGYERAAKRIERTLA